MKYSIKLCLAWLCLLCLNAQAQNPFWTFPEQALDGGFMGNLPTDDYTGQEADYVHAGLKDPYGEIMFFAMDGKLYNKSGEENSEFDDGNEIIRGTSEMLVVPQPGSCNRFYIFQARPKGTGQDSEFPHYSVYDDTLNILRPDQNNQIKTSWNMVDDLSLLTNWGDTDHGVIGVHFAATKERSNGVRWIFISSGNRVYRVNLNCDNLTNEQWQYTIAPLEDDNLERGWRSEMELYEDTASNKVVLATPYRKAFSQTDDQVKIMTLELDSATGNEVVGSRLDIVIPDQTSNAPSYVHGLEFSPNGELLYIIHDPYPGAPSPLSYYNFSTSSLTNLNYTDIANFELSQIQVAGDSANYTMYFASNTHLGTLFDPDNPVSSNWDPDAIAFSGGYSTNFGAGPTFFDPLEKRIIPDQIDYMDYDSMFVKASCDCCNKYAYAGSKKDTSDTFTSNDTWSPGLGNNPWNAAATDTIYIRDSLVVKEGVNITISDLNFKFGRDGVFIVRRGNETTPGARLTLTDSTYMSTDFRCSKFDFPCDDPESDECKNRFWQGIRVEGHPNEPQSLMSSTQQGRLEMNDGCLIEFAQVGILAGHEKLSNYGGGIVRIIDSSIKDSPVSVRFQEYIATNGLGETWNISSVTNMHLYWTDQMLTYEKKMNAHIDVIVSSGIRLRGNTYELQDWISFLPKSRGVGVNSYNSRVLEEYHCPSLSTPCTSPVIRSQFLNLGKGVNAWSDGSTRTVQCFYGEYENNIYGIHCTGLVQPQLFDNDFKVPNTDNYYGIILTNSTGYDVENNYFTSLWSSPVNRNVGVYVQNSGILDNQIYRNSFRNITTGIASVKTNASCSGGAYQFGLRWKCNTFDRDVPYADIFVSTGNVADEQGACTNGQNNLKPANNWFSHTPGAHDLLITTPPDIDLCPGTSLSVQYFHRDVAGGSAFDQRQVPLTFTNSTASPSSHYNPTLCGGDLPGRNDCPVVNSGAPERSRNGGSKSGEEESMNLDDYSTLLSSFYTVNEEILALGDLSEEEISEDEADQLAALYQVEFDLWKEVISAYQWDTLGAFPKEEVFELLNQYEPKATGARFSSALAKEMDLLTPEWVSSSEDVQLAVETSLDFSNETETIEIDQFLEPEFFNSAANTSALVTTLRESGLNYFTYPMDIEADLPAEYTGVEDDSENKSSNMEQSQESISLVPNPFDNYLLIGVETDQEYENMRIEFFDVLGRHIESVNTGFSKSTEINGSNLPVGVIFYQVYLDGKMSQAGRLVKSK